MAIRYAAGDALMRRRLFNLAATISLALCLLTAALWFRSLLVWDTLQIQLPERAIDVDHADGRLRLGTIRHVPEYPIYRERLSHTTSSVRYVENGRCPECGAMRGERSRRVTRQCSGPSRRIGFLGH